MVRERDKLESPSLLYQSSRRIKERVERIGVEARTRTNLRSENLFLKKMDKVNI